MFLGFQVTKPPHYSKLNLYNLKLMDYFITLSTAYI